MREHTPPHQHQATVDACQAARAEAASAQSKADRQGHEVQRLRQELTTCQQHLATSLQEQRAATAAHEAVSKQLHDVRLLPSGNGVLPWVSSRQPGMMCMCVVFNTAWYATHTHRWGGN